jgi:hypothetical protein
MGARDAIAKLISGGIRAFHSSPHDFERFDLSKIGTGEGAQAYGHGIYAAENPAVSGQGGTYWDQFIGRFGGDEGAAARLLRTHGFDRQKAIEASQRELDQLKNDPATARSFGSLIKQRQAQHDLLTSGAPVGPRTYEVNIKADPAQMLDWDKSMSAQPEVMDRIRPLFTDYRLAPSNYLGESVHKEIRDFHTGQGMSKPAAAEATAIDLRSSGIPGIKYLDEGSRTLAARANNPRNANWAADDAAFRATPPTSNYVVFDPADIDILKKYGIAGAAAAPVVGSAMGSTYDQGAYQEPDPMQGTHQ